VDAAGGHLICAPPSWLELVLMGMLFGLKKHEHKKRTVNILRHRKCTSPSLALMDLPLSGKVWATAKRKTHARCLCVRPLSCRTYLQDVNDAKVQNHLLSLGPLCATSAARQGFKVRQRQSTESPPQPGPPVCHKRSTARFQSQAEALPELATPCSKE